ncbi:hypothetical protein ACF0H5_016063 [Mactra antiquata]
MVMINTYMRSGSTILGSLLGHHDDAFYFYEPLQRTHTFNYINGSKFCDYTRPFCYNSPSVMNASLEYVSDIFNCKLVPHINKYNPVIHFQGGHLGPKWTAFSTCMQQIRHNARVSECLVVMENICLNTSYHVIKTLRFSLWDAGHLLEKYPNMFVFQLIRDPRAIIKSHLYTGWFPLDMNNVDSIRSDVITQCGRIRDDLKAWKELVKRFPRRLRLVQYEDLAMNVWKIKTLYTLIGVKNSIDIDNFVNETINRRFDSSRITSQSPMFPRYFGYRDSLPFKIVQIVQDHCEDVIRQLGFEIFQSEEDLRNPNISSIPYRLPFEL